MVIARHDTKPKKQDQSSVECRIVSARRYNFAFSCKRETQEMPTNKRFPPVWAACLVLLAACNSGQSPQGAAVSKDDVAATVNGVPISEKLVAFMLKQRTDLGRPVDAETRKTYLDRLAMQLAVAQEAERKGLDKRPEVIAQIEFNRQSILVNIFIDDFIQGNPITDDEIRAEYERIKTGEAGSEYKARHILVDSEAVAKEIIAKLNRNPGTFDALAREKSKDTFSGTKGGDLGWFLPKRMVPEFSAAVAKLEKGKITQEPVKSQFGYHVILLEDSRSHVAPPFDQHKVRLKEQLQQRKLQAKFDELKAKARIEISQRP